LAKLWLEWNSTTTQKALNLSNFRETLRKWGASHWKIGETVAGVELNNNTESTKQGERWY
jgi:hypothetical protein